MADPDETCPGVWVQLTIGIGYCSLGDECRNPVAEAHERRVDEQAGADRPAG
jgi:hypothetical protein